MDRASAFDEHVSKERLVRLQSARERLADETLVASRQALGLVLRSLGKLKAQRIGAANAARLLAVAIQPQKALFGDEQPLGDQFRTIPPVIVMTGVQRHPEYDWSRLSPELQKYLPEHLKPKKTDA